MMVISILIFANYPKFNQQISLKRTAQEIALAVRQAQLYGMGIKGIVVNGEQKFPGYGIHFDLNSPTSFTLFADLDENYRYDSGQDADVAKFEITKGDKIFDLCVGQKSPTPSCPASCEPTVIDAVYYRTLNVFTTPTNICSDAQIIIKSPEGRTKKIFLWLSGQISVE